MGCALPAIYRHRIDRPHLVRPHHTGAGRSTFISAAGRPARRPFHAQVVRLSDCLVRHAHGGVRMKTSLDSLLDGYLNVRRGAIALALGATVSLGGILG